jgi:hypothetical protein
MRIGFWFSLSSMKDLIAAAALAVILTISSLACPIIYLM